MKFCPECGSQLPLGPAKFCPNCGKSLWNVTESSNTLEEQKEATVQSGQNTIYSLGVKLEQMVEQIMKNKGFSTERRIKLRGQSGIFHEIDVLAKRENDVLAVECKNYGKARLVGIKEITDFQSKLQDLSQINHAMFVVVVETVFITDFSFSPAFANQIESKVVAYQKYLTEQNNLLAIRVIANQTVVQAQATARSNVAELMVSLRQSRSLLHN